MAQQQAGAMMTDNDDGDDGDEDDKPLALQVAGAVITDNDLIDGDDDDNAKATMTKMTFGPPAGRRAPPALYFWGSLVGQPS